MRLAVVWRTALRGWNGSTWAWYAGSHAVGALEVAFRALAVQGRARRTCGYSKNEAQQRDEVLLRGIFELSAASSYYGMPYNRIAVGTVRLGNGFLDMYIP